MSLPIYQVDAFSREPFEGNPAAVCLLDADRDDTWKQSVAAEMNLSETAFVQQAAEGFRLQWFTPTTMQVVGPRVWLTGQAVVRGERIAD